MSGPNPCPKCRSPREVRRQVSRRDAATRSPNVARPTVEQGRATGLVNAWVPAAQALAASVVARHHQNIDPGRSGAVGSISNGVGDRTISSDIVAVGSGVSVWGNAPAVRPAAVSGAWGVAWGVVEQIESGCGIEAGASEHIVGGGSEHRSEHVSEHVTDNPNWTGGITLVGLPTVEGYTADRQRWADAAAADRRRIAENDEFARRVHDETAGLTAERRDRARAARYTTSEPDIQQGVQQGILTQ